MKIIDMIKKYLISSAMVTLFVIYVIYQRVNDAMVTKTNENLVSSTNIIDTIPVVELPPTPTVVSVPDQSVTATTPVPTIVTQIRKIINRFEDDDDDDEGNIPQAATVVAVPATTAKSATTTVKPTAPTAPTTPVVKSTGVYKDGTYSGSVVFVRDGDLQTQAVVQGGKLTDVKFLVLPNGSTQSTKITNFSLPTLRTEAISAQSANVNAVSGATLTSAAFNESLGVALAVAKK